jgi:branched-chain amino acid transport system substrate-binding protein
VERFRKLHPGRTPSSEVSLNYTAVHATVQAMKLAGSVSDATAIRAQLDKGIKALSAANNPNNLAGVDERGASLANLRVAVVENGKVKETTLKDIK